MRRLASTIAAGLAGLVLASGGTVAALPAAADGDYGLPDDKVMYAFEGTPWGAIEEYLFPGDPGDGDWGVVNAWPSPYTDIELGQPAYSPAEDQALLPVRSGGVSRLAVVDLGSAVPRSYTPFTRSDTHAPVDVTAIARTSAGVYYAIDAADDFYLLTPSTAQVSFIANLSSVFASADGSVQALTWNSVQGAFYAFSSYVGGSVPVIAKISAGGAVLQSWVDSSDIGGLPVSRIHSAQYDDAYGIFWIIVKEQAYGELRSQVYAATDPYGGDFDFSKQDDNLVAADINVDPTALLIAPMSRDQHFVVQANRDFLGADPHPIELAEGTRAVFGGQYRTEGDQTARSAYLASLSTSQEWVNHVVTGFYQDTLGRTPNGAEVSYYRNRIVAGERVDVIASNFYASPEYYDGIGGGTDASWVTDLYQKLMNRAPEPGGVAYYVDRLAHGESRTIVALNFYSSPEKLGKRVDALYQDLLQRPGEPAGIEFWKPFVLQHGDLYLARELAASTEYYGKAQTLH